MNMAFIYINILKYIIRIIIIIKNFCLESFIINIVVLNELHFISIIDINNLFLLELLK